MTDYTELVKALRCQSLSKQCDSCKYGYRLCPDSECKDACNVEQIYTDAAAAIEELQAKLEQCTLFNTNLLNMRDMSKEEADEILEYIRTNPVGPIEPMLIEQLPKRGEWIRKDAELYYWHECSKCGERPLYDRYANKVLSAYCPKCGAKMDGKEKDNE